MAWPRREKNVRRDRRIFVRVNAAEQAQLEQTAGTLGITVADFLRRRGLGRRMPATRREEAEEITVFALAAIRNNLNQLMRHFDDDPAMLSKLESTLDRVSGAIEMYGTRD